MVEDCDMKIVEWCKLFRQWYCTGSVSWLTARRSPWTIPSLCKYCKPSVIWYIYTQVLGGYKRTIWSHGIPIVPAADCFAPFPAQKICVGECFLASSKVISYRHVDQIYGHWCPERVEWQNDVIASIQWPRALVSEQRGVRLCIWGRKNHALVDSYIGL